MDGRVRSGHDGVCRNCAPWRAEKSQTFNRAGCFVSAVMAGLDPAIHVLYGLGTETIDPTGVVRVFTVLQCASLGRESGPDPGPAMTSGELRA